VSAGGPHLRSATTKIFTSAFGQITSNVPPVEVRRAGGSAAELTLENWTRAWSARTWNGGHHDAGIAIPLRVNSGMSNFSGSSSIATATARASVGGDQSLRPATASPPRDR